MPQDMAGKQKTRSIQQYNNLQTFVQSNCKVINDYSNISGSSITFISQGKNSTRDNV